MSSESASVSVLRREERREPAASNERLSVSGDARVRLPWYKAAAIPNGLPSRVRLPFALIVLSLTLSISPASAGAAAVAEQLRECADHEDEAPDRAIELAGAILAASSAATERERAEALGCRGWAYSMRQRREEARADAWALQMLLPRLPADAERLRLARRAGAILHQVHDNDAAVEAYAAALAEAESLGLEAERIPILINLGVLHSEFEDFERARIHYDEALALIEGLGDRRHEAPARYNPGLILAAESRHAEAVAQLELVHAAIRTMPDVPAMRRVAVGLALASSLRAIGETGRADELVAWARGIDAPVMDDGVRVPLALLEAEALADAGRPAEALDLLDDFDIDRLPHRVQLNLLRSQADLLLRVGRPEEGVELYRDLLARREAFLRNQNIARLAAMEARLRDREQRLELQRVQVEAEQAAAAHERSVRRWTWALTGGTLLLLAAGVVLWWQRTLNRRLARVSRTDPLTGLANRRAMTSRLREQVARRGPPAAVLLVDVDHFKRMNDVHGHEIGDAVLIEIASRLREEAGADGLVARWGGEEFLVLCPEADRPGSARLAERLCRRVRDPVPTERGPVVVTISIGYCNLPVAGRRDDEDWHASVRLADAALYVAKEQGRDGWAGVWVDREIPDWPPERLAREFSVARERGLIVVDASRLADRAIAVA